MNRSSSVPTKFFSKEKRYKDELTLEKIKQVFVMRCWTKGLYAPLKSFLREIEVKWADPSTALGASVTTLAITKADQRPLLLANKDFMETHCENDSDIGDLVFHEVFHHVFRHIEPENIDQSLNQDIVNFYQDSIINAYLHKFGSAGFMGKYYPDELPYSFLHNRTTKLQINPAEALEDRLAENKKTFFQSLKTIGQKNPNQNIKKEYKEFYRRLYDRNVTNEEAFEFFKKFFTEKPPQGPYLFLGSHGSGGQQNRPGQDSGKSGKTHKSGKLKPDTKENSNEDKGGEKGTKETGSDDKEKNINDLDLGRGKEAGIGIFNLEQIRQILEVLGLKQPDQKAKNNFARVIRQIRMLASKPGRWRKDTRYSKRLPAKINRRDLLNMERDKYLFERGDYKGQEVWLFFDYSGSMDAYQRFMLALVKSLRRDDKIIHIVTWADGIKEVALEEFLQGRIPHVGSGTQGEVVAKFLNENRIKQCVIVTDNCAGQIQTKVSARIFLALVKGASVTGSFLDKTVAPDSHKFELEP